MSDESGLPFSHDEYAGRRERAVELMKKANLDAIVLTSTPNYYYLCGLPIMVSLGVLALVLRADGAGFWIGRRMEMSNVRVLIEKTGWSEIARPIADEEDQYVVFGQALAGLLGPAARVGFELDARTIAPAGVETIAREASGLEIANASGLVESLRVIKSATEIGYMRAAGQMTAKVIKSAVAELVEGQTDSELASRVFSLHTLLGSDPLPMTPMITAGARSAQAHTTYANIPIRRGELITIETGSVVARYCTPSYRIAMVGQPDPEAARFHDASRAGLLAALARVGPGMTSHEADRIVREPIEKAGYGEYFTVRAAYGIGLGFVPTWDEDHIMKLRPGDQRLVRPGMTFHIVPALYKSGTGAACCSNSVHVTENGLEPLVPLEPEMMIV